MKKNILFILLLVSATIFGQTDSVRQLRVFHKDRLIFMQDASKVDSMNFDWVEVDQHQYVDLGLSVKWATCNIGANRPEEFGYYFAWGEVETKSNYSTNNYKWFDAALGMIIEYTTEYSDGINPTALSSDDDAATVFWGDMWRMPTKAELDELTNNCMWKWMTINGVNGYKVTGKNGNSIFLPAAGCRYEGNDFSEGLHGSYWSSTISMDSASYAYEIGFCNGIVYCSYYQRSCGQSIRPVHP